MIGPGGAPFTAGGASLASSQGDGQSRRVGLIVAAALVASLALVVTYLVLGGGSYEPAEARDPCVERPVEWPQGFEAVAERIGLSALDGAACELRVTREDLLIALADPERRARFLDERHVSEERLEAALRAGLERALDDAVAAGAVGGIEALLLRQAIDRAPIGLAVQLAQSETIRDILGLFQYLPG